MELGQFEVFEVLQSKCVYCILIQTIEGDSIWNKFLSRLYGYVTLTLISSICISQFLVCFCPSTIEKKIYENKLLRFNFQLLIAYKNSNYNIIYPFSKFVSQSKACYLQKLIQFLLWEQTQSRMTSGVGMILIRSYSWSN